MTNRLHSRRAELLAMGRAARARLDVAIDALERGADDSSPEAKLVEAFSRIGAPKRLAWAEFVDLVSDAARSRAPLPKVVDYVVSEFADEFPDHAPHDRALVTKAIEAWRAGKQWKAIRAALEHVGADVPKELRDSYSKYRRERGP
jgi:hypothetical protein